MTYINLYGSNPFKKSPCAAICYNNVGNNGNFSLEERMEQLWYLVPMDKSITKQEICDELQKSVAYLRTEESPAMQRTASLHQNMHDSLDRLLEYGVLYGIFKRQ
jgi:hypothetical protein